MANVKVFSIESTALEIAHMGIDEGDGFVSVFANPTNGPTYLIKYGDNQATFIQFDNDRLAKEHLEKVEAYSPDVSVTRL